MKRKSAPKAKVKLKPNEKPDAAPKPKSNLKVAGSSSTSQPKKRKTKKT